MLSAACLAALRSGRALDYLAAAAAFRRAAAGLSAGAPLRRWLVLQHAACVALARLAGPLALPA